MPAAAKLTCSHRMETDMPKRGQPADECRPERMLSSPQTSSASTDEPFTIEASLQSLQFQGDPFDRFDGQAAIGA